MQFKKEEYPIKTLESIGFTRSKCKVCEKHFWSKKSRDYCDDDECRVKLGLPAYDFIGKPVGKKKTYLECWQTFKDTFEKFKHTVIGRYPIIARWRDDVFFVEASIYDFQPYCVSGEVEPPANPLLVPQFCLRFNDLENVGVTGRHYSGFIMVGQHVFNKPEHFIYFKEEGLSYIYNLLTEGFGIPEEEIYFHEDSWEGGGNAGPCIEFFVRGLELGNQVYMQYKKIGDELVELETKVIDMGAGLERFLWLLNGTDTSYEMVFPEALKFLEKFNITDEEKIILADHTRTLLIALSDNALPSNVSGGYNLRKILRRCFSIIRKNNLDLNLVELMKIHSTEFKIYRELRKVKFDFVEDILKEEERKYKETIKAAIRTIKKTENFDEETMRTLYQSQGITPEIIKEVKPEMEIPKNFEVSKKPKKKEQKKAFDVDGLEETEKLYYKGETRTSARVLKVIDAVKKGSDKPVEKEYDKLKNANIVSEDYLRNIAKSLNYNWIILDKTVFYPKSGGQDCDLGMLGECEVLEVIKQGNITLHLVKGKLKYDDFVELVVDEDRRKQLVQHHTSAHIINGAARKVLGEHVQQAGAEKKIDKAHLDMFHFKKISDEELTKIEELANTCIKENHEISINWINRTEAEQKYGFDIYQGGAVPGKEIRIVNVKDWDVEACGGLHLDNTGEADIIAITGIKKLQDSVVRIEFLAGNAARNYLEKMEEFSKQCAEILDCGEEQVFDRAKELFEEWKKKRK